MAVRVPEQEQEQEQDPELAQDGFGRCDCLIVVIVALLARAVHPRHRFGGAQATSHWRRALRA